MRKVRKTIRAVITSTGRIMFWPAKKYIKVMAKSYEVMLGDNVKYFNPCI